MNAYELYDAAIDNVNINGIEDPVDATYFSDYAFNALDISISDETATAMESAHKAWEETEDKNSNTYYYTVIKVLEDIEL